MSGKGRWLLHVGAGFGQEIPNYQSLGFHVVCIEADKASAERVRATHPLVVCIHATVSDQNIIRTWYPTIPPECSSLHEIDPEVAAKHFPSIQVLPPTTVKCMTVDGIGVLPKFDVLVTDVQGHDYEVLEGSARVLSSCKIVICEVWNKILYKGTRLLSDVQKLLDGYGFGLKQFLPGDKPEFWGDAIFVRRQT